MESRRYPSACMSAYCGKTTCPATCSNLPALNEFREWKKRTKATRLDEIWCPSFWTATVKVTT